MMPFRKGVATALTAAGLFTYLYAQDIPKEISLKTGEEKYCAAALQDLKGTNFSGIVRVYRPDDKNLHFYVIQEHTTYKAPNNKEAFKYGPQRAVVVINGSKVGDNIIDVLTIDNEAFFGNEDPKTSQLTGDKLRFINDVLTCAVKAE